MTLRYSMLVFCASGALSRLTACETSTVTFGFSATSCASRPKREKCSKNALPAKRYDCATT